MDDKPGNVHINDKVSVKGLIRYAMNIKKKKRKTTKKGRVCVREAEPRREGIEICVVGQESGMQTSNARRQLWEERGFGEQRTREETQARMSEWEKRSYYKGQDDGRDEQDGDGECMAQ
jgi:hypothetical protein